MTNVPIIQNTNLRWNCFLSDSCIPVKLFAVRSCDVFRPYKCQRDGTCSPNNHMINLIHVELSVRRTRPTKHWFRL